jgi:HEAT repeat protein
MNGVRSTERAPAAPEPRALRRAVWSSDEAIAAAAWEELGRQAARYGWARRLLSDVARGCLALPPWAAEPGLRTLACLDPPCVTGLAVETDTAAAAVAAAALGQAGDSVKPQLLGLARQEAVSVRLAAVAGLGEAAARASVWAVEELAARLEDPDGEVRWAAAAALGRAGGKVCAERAGFWLDQAVSRGDERALSGAALGAGRLWATRRREGTRLLVLAAEAGLAGRKAAALAVADLPPRVGSRVADLCVADRDPGVRAASVGALARWAADGSKKARRLLARLARDGDAGVRAAAAVQLAGRPGAGSLDLVARLGGDKSPWVRAAVAEGLGGRDDQEGMGQISALARDEVAVVRAAGVRALGQRGDEELVREACTDSEPEVRAAAASALVPRGEQDAELLLVLSQDRSGEVMRASARALGRHPDALSSPIWGRLVELAAVGVVASAAAEGMAAALDQAPRAAPDVFRGWPVGRAGASVVSGIARAARRPEVAELARTTSRALRAEERSGEALRDLSASFGDAGDERTAGVCSWLADCADVASLREVVRIGADGPTGRGGAAAHLAAVGRNIASHLKARSAASRVRALARASAGLEAVLSVEADRPEWVFVQRVAKRWRRLIAELEPREDRAEIKAWVASANVVAGQAPTALVAVESRGRAQVSEVSIHVDGTGGPVQLASLPAGAKTEAEVSLPPARPGRVQVCGAVRFRDGTEKRTNRFEGVVRAWEPQTLGAAANPYVVGKPLAADNAMFFGRGAEMEFVERALASGGAGAAVVLVGQRRTGKTSLLRRLEAELAGRYRPVFVDVQGMLVTDTRDFFRELARRAAGGRHEGSMLADGHDVRQYGGAGADLVREVAAQYGHRIVLLLDEFDDLEEKVRSGRLGQEVFSQLRNLIQHTDTVSLVLSGTHRLEELASEYWSFLFNLATYRRVGCLDEAPAGDVLRAPLRRLGIVYEDAAIARALRLTGRHPYLLQLLGYHLVEECVSSGEGAVRVGAVERAAGVVVEQGDIHLRYLWDSCGREAKRIVGVLAEGNREVGSEGLGEATRLGAADLRAGLRELSGSELLWERGGRYGLNIGVLARWVEEVQPEGHEAVQ